MSSVSILAKNRSDLGDDPGVHITKNPNLDPILTFSYFHYKS